MIELRPKRQFSELRVVIQAGGRGERMKALGLPKPLVEVSGVAMVERLIRQLAAAGAHDIEVITGWRGDEVEAKLREMASASAARIHVHREIVPRGTMGTLAELRQDDRAVLFCFADLVTDLDFGELLRVHDAFGADITLCSHEEMHQVRLGELIAQGDQVLGYREKPIKRFLICSGIAVLEPSAVGLLRRAEPAGFPELVGNCLEAGLSVRHWQHHALWIDVNTPDDVEAAEQIIASIRPLQAVARL
jgi:NDP-mannose synthase